MFAVETSPTAKLDEAVALVTLAGRSPRRSVSKKSSTSAGDRHASFGDDLIDLALADPTKPPTAAPRWQIKNRPSDTSRCPMVDSIAGGAESRCPTTRTFEKTSTAYSRFQDLADHDLRNIPAQPLADALSEAMRRGPSPPALPLLPRC